MAGRKQRKRAPRGKQNGKQPAYSDASRTRVPSEAANYYRVARKKGVKLQRRRRSSSPGRAVSSGRIAALLQELAALLKDQARTIAELRKENEQFGRLRQVLSTL